MAKFELCIRAQNFKIKEGGKVRTTGFYAGRGVEAATMSEATEKAMNMIRADLRPLSLNEHGNPPKFNVVEIEEVYYFQESIDIGEKVIPTEGYVWDEEDEETGDVKKPLSAWRGGWANFSKDVREKKAHVHTMSVHFTNGLYPVALLFLFLSLLFGNPSFEKTYFYLMVIATLSVPVTYLTGLLEWKRRHQSAMIPIFVTKIRYGLVAAFIGGGCTFWYALSPEVLGSGILTLFFVLLNLAILPPLVYLGHLGGIIVYEKAD